ncbi:MAG: GNAT family N-acetyltransferase [Oceanospirillaceae bacterium]|nr:GNAT family N-acetyltransferase [Oceanospirillaceae bacterium]
MTVKIQVVDEFNQWQELLNLLFSAFEFQHSRIDPPSSLLLLNVNSIIEKASAEQLMVALKDGELVGCVFVRNQGNLLYVGKLAVAKHLQGCGIARQLMQEVESYAKGESKEVLELQVRIELVENIAAFSALGFVESGRTAHRGYDRMTSVTMQKFL